MIHVSRYSKLMNSVRSISSCVQTVRRSWSSTAICPTIHLFYSEGIWWRCSSTDVRYRTRMRSSFRTSLTVSTRPSLRVRSCTLSRDCMSEARASVRFLTAVSLIHGSMPGESSTAFLLHISILYHQKFFLNIFRKINF